MEIEKIRDYIISFQKAQFPSLISRELSISPKTTIINTLIGPRRAGKTYYFYQLMLPLDRSKVIYLNFEDIRLESILPKNFLDIVNLHIEITGKMPEYIFLDEPQIIEGWEKGVRTLFDQHRYKILITGSSSKLLSKEVATHLRGRTITHLLLPYSFNEFLIANDVKLQWPMSSEEIAGINHYLDLWLYWGGYPEVVKAGEIEKMKLLDTYKDLIVYKDIIERYRARSPLLAKLLIDHLFSAFAKEFSINSFFNVLKSRNIEVSKKTLYSYLSFIEDSMSIFLLERYSPKIKERRLSNKKVYLCDNGLVYKQGKEKSKLMENAVFLQLKRIQSLNPKINLFYWKDSGGEVDFVVMEGKEIKKLIQVTFADSRESIEKREINSLIIASKQLKCKTLEIITWNYEGSEKISGKTIAFIPLWKWLLTQN
jgi:predicted AAA+ superfamily ATPase